ncbi:MAG: glucose/sorbosone family PQQ-dependent dehydrogenase [Catalinimonas sp.]
MTRPLRWLLPCLLLCTLRVQAQSEVEGFVMTQLLPDRSLASPWEMVFGPDSTLWVTERTGKRVQRIDPETGEFDRLVSIPGVFQDAGQDGLLGMALHPELGTGTGNDYVYLSYTYQDGGRRQQIVRYTYSITDNDGTLADPDTLIDGLPASNDHNSGRLIFGPDGLLYYTIGDQGANQFGNRCNPIEAQRLPTQEEVDAEDWGAYKGKVLRLNTDGSVPDDNPLLEGVRSHVYSYGHRNPQGLVFGPGGKLYSNEHGPKSDDEVNLIVAGGNYGWPHVAGFQDDSAYAFCDWSSAPDCGDLRYSDYNCPEGATQTAETAWEAPENFVEPLKALFTVGNDYNFQDSECQAAFICWPSVAPSSLDYYAPGPDSIPGWGHSLLVVSLKRGAVYRFALSTDRDSIVSDTMKIWNTQNRYRDIALHPDGRTFYVATDPSGQTSGPSGGNTGQLDNPGTILRFRYEVISTARADAVREPLFTLAPNPAGERVRVRPADHLTGELYTVELLDLSGRALRTYTTGDAELLLDLNGTAAGMYAVRLTTTRGERHVRRLVVR